MFSLFALSIVLVIGVGASADARSMSSVSRGLIAVSLALIGSASLGLFALHRTNKQAGLTPSPPRGPLPGGSDPPAPTSLSCVVKGITSPVSPSTIVNATVEIALPDSILVAQLPTMGTPLTANEGWTGFKCDPAISTQTDPHGHHAEIKFQFVTPPQAPAGSPPISKSLRLHIHFLAKSSAKDPGLDIEQDLSAIDVRLPPPLPKALPVKPPRTSLKTHHRPHPPKKRPKLTDNGVKPIIVR